ncbi:MAG: ferredoxin [Parcubacteria group bacterium Licking1014_1]|nr:MAG: ferredoxin [Parcubacteria group bacterium Licking1014_1]
MAKIKLEREKCIGCGSCQVICPEYFELAEDGKAHIKNSNKADIEELEIKKIKCAESALESCPVQCIYIKK